jgi:hypothetical protein
MLGTEPCCSRPPAIPLCRPGPYASGGGRLLRRRSDGPAGRRSCRSRRSSSRGARTPGPHLTRQCVSGDDGGVAPWCRAKSVRFSAASWANLGAFWAMALVIGEDCCAGGSNARSWSPLTRKAGKSRLKRAVDWRGRSMNDRGIGASVRRKEDFRFLTGAGNYTGDINYRDQLTGGTRRTHRDGRRRKWRDGQDTVWHGHLRIALARIRRLGSGHGDRQVSKGKKIAARARCPRKPLPPQCRRSSPASIRGSRDWRSP